MKPVTPLPSCMTPFILEAGCDEAGRGCLAGPVYAAAVILPDGFTHPWLNDSKKLTPARRDMMRTIIETEAIAWAVASVDATEIDRINILNASIAAMHKALDALTVRPGAVIIDGNRFKPYGDLNCTTVVKGDGKYGNIAAASILAKTYRDEYMTRMHDIYPCYDWNINKGYPTRRHREAIAMNGLSPLHRLTFSVKS